MKTQTLQAIDYLKGCASFLAHLKPFMNLRETPQGIECEMIMTNGLPLKVSGKDEAHLALSLMSVLVHLFPDTRCDKPLPTEPVMQPASLINEPLETTMQSLITTQDMSERNQATRLQIGVTTKVSQHELVKKVAKRRGVPVSTAAIDLLRDGLNRFDQESCIISPSDLLIDYERIANDYEGAESESWIIRADRRLVMKTRFRAGEYGCSLSSFTNFILASALSHCAVAAAIHAESSQPIISDEAVADALKVIDQSVGPKARNLTFQIGLGEQRVLTNMILGGTVMAPARVLAKLASALKLSLDVLSVALERRFANQPVPAFKATEGKPSVQVERKAWGVAVRELQLSNDEQERLLELEG